MSSAAAEPAPAPQQSRGAYLAKIGDCAACHTASGSDSAPYAGGLAINSPFGIIYSTNITPDPVAGIGRYSYDDFRLALREGIRKDGKRLYPAMPYASFTAITDDDLHALYDYFMHEVRPIAARPPVTALPFPVNQRWTLMFWDAAFVKHQRYEPHPNRDAQWNRGAYLVQSLGHCGACHTPRGLAYQEKGYDEQSPVFLKGNVIDNWFAANLRGNHASGLGRWSEADISGFLRTGHGAGSAVFGSMLEVIEKSTQYLYKEDLDAIAHYLKTLSPQPERSAYKPLASAAARSVETSLTHPREDPGAGIYESYCAKCHKKNGRGDPPKFPGLAGSPIVLSENASSLIRLALEGGRTAKTRYGVKPEKMPKFARRLTDGEIAEVLSFIRNSWGNAAAPVTARAVYLLRRDLQK
ncbi:c-type cytochrome [Candidatus Methylobacter favarea]|uniref:c-type cytochrome n=1 Tax=Candidatus Methylobacter favarea TaxID=2707345 RepID=UPI001FE61776|nr:cytochrome c [Candidatus Methylobacter favarea]